MISDDEFSFEGSIIRLDDWMRMHAIRIPDETAELMIASGNKRFLGTINGFKVNRAIQSRKEVGYIISVGSDLLQEGDLKAGSHVEVILRPDPNPDYIDIPEEFANVLEQDEEAALKWEEMTPGRQRGLVHYLNSAKRADTKIKRALEVALKLKNEGFFSST